MLKPSLQLKLGQQLTMTPQLQQAIRLLQLPALELQAHIRELLETNVMLEPDEAEASGTFEVRVTAAEQPKPPENAAESTVEVLDEGWGDHSVGPAETPWSGDADERQPGADHGMHANIDGLPAPAQAAEVRISATGNPAPLPPAASGWDTSSPSPRLCPERAPRPPASSYRRRRLAGARNRGGRRGFSP